MRNAVADTCTLQGEIFGGLGERIRRVEQQCDRFKLLSDREKRDLDDATLFPCDVPDKSIGLEEASAGYGLVRAARRVDLILPQVFPYWRRNWCSVDPCPSRAAGLVIIARRFGDPGMILSPPEW